MFCVFFLSFFPLFVFSCSGVFDFVLYHYIIFYYYPLGTCLFSNKETERRWIHMRGEERPERTRGGGTYVM